MLTGACNNQTIYCEPTTPLKHSDTSLQKLMFCSEKNIPLIYTPAPSAGGTAPVTLAGVLSVDTAEILAGLVLNQAISKGTPFIFGGVFSIMDMKTMNFSSGHHITSGTMQGESPWPGY